VDLKGLPAGTQWLLEVDARAAASSSLAGMCKERMAVESKCAKALAKLDAFKAATGIDVARDIDGIVVYGRAVGDKSGVAMIRGKWDVAKVTAFVGLQRDFGTRTHNDKTILTWFDKQAVHLCLVSPELALLSINETQLMLALDTLAGRQPGLAADSGLAGFNRVAGRPMIRFLADGVNTAPQVNAQAALLQQTDTLQFSLEETPADGALVAELALGLLSAEAAGQMVQMLQGMHALVQLKHADKPGILALMNAVKITGADSTVTIRAAMDRALVETMKALCPMRGGSEQAPE
jgi:hypothetical protein